MDRVNADNFKRERQRWMIYSSVVGHRKIGNMQALSGIRVLEFSSTIAATYCARQFAMWGAEVLAVRDAWVGSQFQYPAVDNSGNPFSLLQECLHTGKSMIGGEAVTTDLIENADILITDRSEGELALIPAFKEVSTWPILLDISPFGRTGPYSSYTGTELIVEAMSGFLSVNGSRGRAPLRMPGNLIGYICGVNGFIAGLAALHRRSGSGVSEKVEVSWMETLMTIVPTLRTQVLGQVEQRDSGPGTDPLGVRLYEIGDGYLSFNLAYKIALEVLLEIVGLDEKDLPEHLDSFEKRQDYDALFEYIRTLDSPFSIDDLFQIISDPPHSSAVGKVKSPIEILQDPQLLALDYFRDVDHPVLGPISRTGPPARMSLTPAMNPLSRRIEPGSVNWSKRDSVPDSQTHELSRPLENIVIVDLTQAWIGPFASQLLSDLGAEVIKVESVHKPDVWRSLPPKKPEGIVNKDAKLVNTSSNFNSVNRDKKSLTLDLGQEEGRRLFRELVADADIVMENYTPNVMKKFGLAYEDLIKINPEIIMTSFSGYGNMGPYASYRANGTTIEATAGWDSLFGYADGPPMVMGFYQADTGLQMAATTLTALNCRNRTGQGQYVQGSMFEAAVGYIDELILEASLGRHHDRLGNRHPDMFIQGVYPCKDVDQWVAITVRNETEFDLFQEIAKLNPSEPEETEQQRMDRLDADISNWSRRFSSYEVTRMLQAISIAAAPVQSTSEVLTDPHLTARCWFNELTHPDLGTHLYDGFSWRFSESQLRSEFHSPRLGENSREILRDKFGLSEAEIGELIDQGITGEVF